MPLSERSTNLGLFAASAMRAFSWLAFYLHISRQIVVFSFHLFPFSYQASTNPFATSSRPLTGQSTNPFSANQPPKPSLNQLSSAAAAAAANGTTLTTLGGRLPSAFTSFTPQRAPFMASGPTFFPGQVAPTSAGAPQQSQLPQQQQSLNPFFWSYFSPTHLPIHQPKDWPTVVWPTDNLCCMPLSPSISSPTPFTRLIL